MILDCTLRDGGYHTNWEFDDNLVREMISTLDVDYIELGYKSNLSGGRFKNVIKLLTVESANGNQDPF